MSDDRPRLIILKDALANLAPALPALRQSFDLIEVDDLPAAQKILEHPLGSFVLWNQSESTELASDMAANGASTVLQHIGEGVLVVDRAGSIVWADKRFRSLDEPTRSRLASLCHSTIQYYNAPSSPIIARHSGDSRKPRRYGIDIGERFFELVVSPQSYESAGASPSSSSAVATASAVTCVVGVLWEATVAHKLQEKLLAIDAAGSELLRLEPAAIAKLNMGERLKLLEDKIVRTVKELLKFDNFEVRLIDPHSGRLELVIAVNISPLKIGEVMYARPEGNGISGYVASTGKSYLCPDVQNDPLYREGLDNAASSLTVPLFLHEKVIGVFNVESFQPGAFDDNDRMFAEIYGRYIATAMNILNLLVVERFTTNEQIAQNVLSEMNAPLTDLVTEIESISKKPDCSPEDLAAWLEKLRHIATLMRARVKSCTSGSRTVLLAEQDLKQSLAGTSFAGKRILVADDEPAIRETLTQLLRNIGCVV
ncbi:MAG TPA: GAF domain-containing protein, partial [Phycisphaerales bacterium]|nr:GAF domain-containing protein [Phycisphaerales bacterium]